MQKENKSSPKRVKLPAKKKATSRWKLKNATKKIRLKRSKTIQLQKENKNLFTNPLLKQKKDYFVDDQT